MTLSQLSLSAIPDSPYGAELQRGSASLSFGSQTLEAEYLRADLIRSRTLIRIACTLAALLTVFRGVEQAIEGFAGGVFPIDFGLVILGSLVLASIAWSPIFESRFLQWARIIVPIRNVIVPR